MAVGTFGPIFATIALAFGLFFFIFAARYYIFTATIFLLQLFRDGNHKNGSNGNNLRAKYATNGGTANRRLSKFFGFMNNHGNGNGCRNHATNGNGSERFAIEISSEPFVSIHLPFYNERNVAERILSACMSLDYGNYEVIVVDDSTDETVALLEQWKEYQASMTYALNGAGRGSGQLVALELLQRPALKIVHREKRTGFKGGALNEALKHMDPRAEYVIVLDADFVPPPDLINSFLSYVAVESAASVFKRIIEIDRKFAAGEISVEDYLSERESLVDQVVGRRSIREALKAGGDAIFKLDQLYAEERIDLEEYFTRRRAIVKTLEALGLGRIVYEPFEDRFALIHTFDLDQLLAEGKIEIREYVRRRRLLEPRLAALRKPEELTVADVLDLDRLYAKGRILDEEWYLRERRWLVDRLTLSSTDREMLKSDFDADQLYASGKLDEKKYAQRKRFANGALMYNGGDHEGNNHSNNRRVFRILWRNGNNRNHRNKSSHNSNHNNNHNGRNGNGYVNGELAAIQGYQWHCLNKSENWLTEGIRVEYSGNYVIERTCEEIFGGMKMIAGSVYMIRADLLRKYGWSTSITEDWELTCRLYKDGYKVLYSPLIQVPAECPSTITRLIRQRQRWAEGHTYNAKKHFWAIMRSKKISIREKLEFLYFAPYYLQSVFFMIGTFFWLLSETTHEYLPFWSAQFGWSLLLSNLISLPLMNLAGLHAEETARKDWTGVLSTIVMSYILAPFQAYSALKGLLEKREGHWIRTFKTGKITEPIIALKLARVWRRLRTRKKPRRGTSGKEKAASASLVPVQKQGDEDRSKWSRTLRKRNLGCVLLLLLSTGLLGIAFIANMLPATPVFASPGTTWYLSSTNHGTITGGTYNKIMYQDSGGGGSFGVSGGSTKVWFGSSNSYSLSITAQTWSYSVDITSSTYTSKTNWEVTVGYVLTSAPGTFISLTTMHSFQTCKPTCSMTLSASDSGSAATPSGSYYIVLQVTTPNANKDATLNATTGNLMSTQDIPEFAMIAIPLVVFIPKILSRRRRGKQQQAKVTI